MNFISSKKSLVPKEIYVNDFLIVTNDDPTISLRTVTSQKKKSYLNNYILMFRAEGKIMVFL